MDHDNNRPATRDYFLKPGYIYFPDRPTTISTVLGSSVALALYDRSRKTGGMNHFLFPMSGAEKKSTALYGNVAIPALIRMMQERGSKLSNLEAQLFGGAFNREYSSEDIGAASLKIGRQILEQKRIRIVSEDTGGELGRKIVFNTANCEIVILKVDRLRAGDWHPYRHNR